MVRKNKKNFIAGFTLLELIISGALIFLVSVTVYSVFASGISVWKRANQARSAGYGLRLLADKLSVELRNAFRFSTIPFEGKQDSIAFAGLIDNQVSRISYFLNEEDTFCRRLQSYPDVFKKGESGKYELLLPGVSKLKFSYCYLDNASGDYKWKDDWVKEEQDTIPRAVKIELTYKGKPEEELKFIKTVFIPIGTGEQKIELVQ
ncbi:MAG: type II secretion system protein GspJ [Candidatus Omnitrophica bacterium]|nr:type II secretion system protein GspJ [Candidatus Omnitrophota bacterium]